MTQDTLIFKDKIIRDRDVELTFYKDVYWIYNDEPKPVIKFTLKNCRDLDKMDFSSMDYYNDGLTIEIKEMGNNFVLEITDIDDIKMTVLCDKIEKEELEYSSNDYIYLIKEFTNQRDEAYRSLTILNERIDSLKRFLHRENDIIDRKIEQAGWLTDDKKHSLESRKNMIKSILGRLHEKKD